ncbi:MAG: hypothetical protein ACRDAM_12095, partial [Casimicrobium sp.]
VSTVEHCPTVNSCASKSVSVESLKERIEDFDPSCNAYNDAAKIRSDMRELRNRLTSKASTEDRDEINYLFDQMETSFKYASSIDRINSDGKFSTQSDIAKDLEVINLTLDYVEKLTCGAGAAAVAGAVETAGHTNQFDAIVKKDSQAICDRANELNEQQQSLIQQANSALASGDHEKAKALLDKLESLDGEYQALIHDAKAVGMLDSNAKAVVGMAAANYDAKTKEARDIMEGNGNEEFYNEDGSLNQKGSFYVQQVLMEAQLQLSLANTIIRIAAQVASQAAKPIPAG